MPSSLVSSVANSTTLTMGNTNMNAVLTQTKIIYVPHVAMDSIINHSWICILQLMTPVPKCYIGINPNTSKPKGIAFNA